MIIFPILKNNSLAAELYTLIQEFWTKIYNNDVNNYVFLHKNEFGAAINLNESKDSTQILSIHSSKGNGRNVVILLGLTEYTLGFFSL